MGANIEVDWRVSAARQSAWESPPLPPPYHSIPLETRMNAIRRKQDQQVHPPDFLKHPNSQNICKEIRQSTNLVNIFRFTRYCDQAVADALPRNSLTSASSADKFSQPDLASELERIFPPGLSVAKVADTPAREWEPREQFLQRFFHRLAPLDKASSTPSAQWHGVWVGLWDEFQPWLNSGPEAWMSVFGVPLPDSPVLCLVMRYTVGHIRPLVRPTIIDAGWHPEHFPNPAPECILVDTTSGLRLRGHPMSLLNASTPLRQEFVHRDRRRSAGWVVAWGWLPAGRRARDIVGTRTAHHQLLQSHYSGVKNWMAEPV